MSAPFFDSERIREFEENELADRLEAGAALGRSRLPPEVLRRALSNDQWFEAPDEKKEKEERDGGKEKEERKERIGQTLKSYPKRKEKVTNVPCPRDEGPIPS